MHIARQIDAVKTFRINEDKKLKSIDSDSWFHSLIIRSEKSTDQ